MSTESTLHYFSLKPYILMSIVKLMLPEILPAIFRDLPYKNLIGSKCCSNWKEK